MAGALNIEYRTRNVEGSDSTFDILRFGIQQTPSITLNTAINKARETQHSKHATLRRLPRCLPPRRRLRCLLRKNLCVGRLRARVAPALPRRHAPQAHRRLPQRPGLDRQMAPLPGQAVAA